MGNTKSFKINLNNNNTQNTFPNGISNEIIYINDIPYIVMKNLSLNTILVKSLIREKMSMSATTTAIGMNMKNHKNEINTEYNHHQHYYPSSKFIIKTIQINSYDDVENLNQIFKNGIPGYMTKMRLLHKKLNINVGELKSSESMKPPTVNDNPLAKERSSSITAPKKTNDNCYYTYECNSKSYQSMKKSTISLTTNNNNNNNNSPLISPKSSSITKSTLITSDNSYLMMLIKESNLINPNTTTGNNNNNDPFHNNNNHHHHNPLPHPDHHLTRQSHILHIEICDYYPYNLQTYCELIKKNEDLYYVFQLAKKALKELHRNNIYHGNIKPTNILLYYIYPSENNTNNKLSKGDKFDLNKNHEKHNDNPDHNHNPDHKVNTALISSPIAMINNEYPINTDISIHNLINKNNNIHYASSIRNEEIEDANACDDNLHNITEKSFENLLNNDQYDHDIMYVNNKYHVNNHIQQQHLNGGLSSMSNTPDNLRLHFADTSLIFFETKQNIKYNECMHPDFKHVLNKFQDSKLRIANFKKKWDEYSLGITFIIGLIKFLKTPQIIPNEELLMQYFCNVKNQVGNELLLEICQLLQIKERYIEYLYKTNKFNASDTSLKEIIPYDLKYPNGCASLLGDVNSNSDKAIQETEEHKLQALNNKMSSIGNVRKGQCETECGNINEQNDKEPKHTNQSSEKHIKNNNSDLYLTNIPNQIIIHEDLASFNRENVIKKSNTSNKGTPNHYDIIDTTKKPFFFKKSDGLTHNPNDMNNIEDIKASNSIKNHVQMNQDINNTKNKRNLQIQDNFLEISLILKPKKSKLMRLNTIYEEEKKQDWSLNDNRQDLRENIHKSPIITTITTMTTPTHHKQMKSYHSSKEKVISKNPSCSLTKKGDSHLHPPHGHAHIHAHPHNQQQLVQQPLQHHHQLSKPSSSKGLKKPNHDDDYDTKGNLPNHPNLKDHNTHNKSGFSDILLNLSSIMDTQSYSENDFSHINFEYSIIDETKTQVKILNDNEMDCKQQNKNRNSNNNTQELFIPNVNNNKNSGRSSSNNNSDINTRQRNKDSRGYNVSESKGRIENDQIHQVYDQTQQQPQTQQQSQEQYQQQSQERHMSNKIKIINETSRKKTSNAGITGAGASATGAGLSQKSGSDHQGKKSIISISNNTKASIIISSNDVNTKVNTNIDNGQNTQNNPNIQRSLNIQSSPKMQYSPNMQHSPNVQYSPNVQNSPNIQRSLNIQNSPNIQYGPNAQNSLNVQYGPNIQHGSNVQYSPSVQNSPNMQYGLNVQYSPNVQHSPNILNTKKDRATSGNLIIKNNEVITTTTTSNISTISGSNQDIKPPLLVNTNNNNMRESSESSSNIKTNNQKSEHRAKKSINIRKKYEIPNRLTTIQDLDSNDNMGINSIIKDKNTLSIVIPNVHYSNVNNNNKDSNDDNNKKTMIDSTNTNLLTMKALNNTISSYNNKSHANSLNGLLILKESQISPKSNLSIMTKGKNNDSQSKSISSTSTLNALGKTIIFSKSRVGISSKELIKSNVSNMEQILDKNLNTDISIITNTNTNPNKDTNITINKNNPIKDNTKTINKDNLKNDNKDNNNKDNTNNNTTTDKKFPEGYNIPLTGCKSPIGTTPITTTTTMTTSVLTSIISKKDITPLNSPSNNKAININKKCSQGDMAINNGNINKTPAENYSSQENTVNKTKDDTQRILGNTNTNTNSSGYITLTMLKSGIEMTNSGFNTNGSVTMTTSTGFNLMRASTINLEGSESPNRIALQANLGKNPFEGIVNNTNGNANACLSGGNSVGNTGGGCGNGNGGGGGSVNGNTSGNVGNIRNMIKMNWTFLRSAKMNLLKGYKSNCLDNVVDSTYFLKDDNSFNFFHSFDWNNALLRYYGQFDFKTKSKIGFGIYFYTFDESYIGEWKDNQRHGHGAYYYKNHEYYIGQWKEDLYDGEGIYYTSKGEIKYKGNFSKGKIFGQGQCLLDNGQIYYGEFINGQMHGQGFVYFPTEMSKRLKGKWRDGKKEGPFELYDYEGHHVKRLYFENDEEIKGKIIMSKHNPYQLKMIDEMMEYNSVSGASGTSGSSGSGGGSGATSANGGVIGANGGSSGANRGANCGANGSANCGANGGANGGTIDGNRGANGGATGANSTSGVGMGNNRGSFAIADSITQIPKKPGLSGLSKPPLEAMNEAKMIIPNTTSTALTTTTTTPTTTKTTATTMTAVLDKLNSPKSNITFSLKKHEEIKKPEREGQMIDNGVNSLMIPHLDSASASNLALTSTSKLALASTSNLASSSASIMMMKNGYMITSENIEALKRGGRLSTIHIDVYFMEMKKTHDNDFLQCNKNIFERHLTGQLKRILYLDTNFMSLIMNPMNMTMTTGPMMATMTMMMNAATATTANGIDCYNNVKYLFRPYTIKGMTIFDIYDKIFIPVQLNPAINNTPNNESNWCLAEIDCDIEDRFEFKIYDPSPLMGNYEKIIEALKNFIQGYVKDICFNMSEDNAGYFMTNMVISSILANNNTNSSNDDLNPNNPEDMMNTMKQEIPPDIKDNDTNAMVSSRYNTQTLLHSDNVKQRKEVIINSTPIASTTTTTTPTSKNPNPNNSTTTITKTSKNLSANLNPNPNNSTITTTSTNPNPNLNSNINSNPNPNNSTITTNPISGSSSNTIMNTNPNPNTALFRSIKDKDCTIYTQYMKKLSNSKAIYQHKVKRKQNNMDCGGLFVCGYLKDITFNKDITFSQKDCENMRKELLELLVAYSHSQSQSQPLNQSLGQSLVQPQPLSLPISIPLSQPLSQPQSQILYQPLGQSHSQTLSHQILGQTHSQAVGQPHSQPLVQSYAQSRSQPHS